MITLLYTTKYFRYYTDPMYEGNVQIGLIPGIKLSNKLCNFFNSTAKSHWFFTNDINGLTQLDRVRNYWPTLKFKERVMGNGKVIKLTIK